MKSKFIHKFLLSAMVALFIVSFFGQAFSAISYVFFWSKDVTFRLSSYGTKVGFDEDFYLVSFSFIDGTDLSFSNILVNENVEVFRVSTQTANMTITTLSDSELDYSVTGAGTQAFYLENKVPITCTIDNVAGTEGTDYTVTDGTVTVTTATSNASFTFNSDNDLSLLYGRGSASGLIFVAFIIGLAALVIVIMKKQGDSS